MAIYYPKDVAKIVGLSTATLKNISTRFALLLSPGASKAPLLPDGRYGQRAYTSDDLIVLKKISRLIQQEKTFEEIEVELGLRQPEPSPQEVVAKALSSAATALDPSQAPAASATPTAPDKPVGKTPTQLALLQQALASYQARLERLEQTASEPPKPVVSAEEWAELLQAMTQQQTHLAQLEATRQTAPSRDDLQQTLQQLAQQQTRLNQVETAATQFAPLSDVASIKQVVAAQQTRLEQLNRQLSIQPAPTLSLGELKPLLERIANQQEQLNRLEARLVLTEERLATAYTLMANHLFISQSRRSGRWNRYLIWRDHQMVFQFYLGPASEQEIKELQTQATQLEASLYPVAPQNPKSEN